MWQGSLETASRSWSILSSGCCRWRRGPTWWERRTLSARPRGRFGKRVWPRFFRTGAARVSYCPPPSQKTCIWGVHTHVSDGVWSIPVTERRKPAGESRSLRLPLPARIPRWPRYPVDINNVWSRRASWPGSRCSLSPMTRPEDWMFAPLPE